MTRPPLRLLPLLGLLSCTTPKPGTDRALIGSFVSGTVAGQSGGTSLRGQFLWHGRIQGSSNGVQLSGSLH